MKLTADGIGFIISHTNAMINGDAGMFLAFDWAAVTGACVVVRFFQKKKPIRNFSLFFKIASAEFIPVYLFALIIILFLGDGRTFYTHYHYRDLNLIPFVKTILPYITGTARTSNNTIVYNLLANILLFAPVGFYAGVFSRKLPVWTRAVIIVGAPVLALFEFKSEKEAQSDIKAAGLGKEIRIDEV